MNLYRSATGRVILASYPKEKASRLINSIKKALETAAKEIEDKIANGISIDVL